MQDSIIMGKIKNIIEKFPKKLMRRLFGIFAVCWLSLAIFSPSVCYAAADNNKQAELQKQEEFNIEIKSVINMLSQIVYIFLWPLLVIAWTALDNTLVYGKFLNLDAALWDIWNIMKNVANFALWFVFIFAIVRNLFKTSFWDGNPIQDATKVVSKTLIAWVLIQMSWFILGVLLDLSTILIYAIWGLPLSMLGSYSTDLSSIPIMELHTNINENSSWSFFYYYSYWDYNFSPCFVIDNDSSSADFTLKGYEWKYIAWRRYLYLSWEETFNDGYCVLYGYPYHYVESTWFFRTGGCTEQYPCYEKSWTTLAAMNANYYAQLKNYLDKIWTWGVKNEVDGCSVIRAYWTWCVLSNDTWTRYWAMSSTWDIFKSAQWKLDSLLERSKWWVGPLVTMYSSILRVQELLVNPGEASTMSSLFWAIINTFFVVVLFIPIAILAILLIIRIWFLWITIAISPILILINLGPDPINKLWKNKIFEKFTMKETFIRIFSPIVVVFAVSLSIIFLATIHSLEPKNNQQFLNSLWIEENCEWNWQATNSGWEWAQWGEAGNASGGWELTEWVGSGVSSENCRYTVSWLVDVKINLSGFNHWKNVFVWCLMMLLSTWIVRFFMKFAIWVMWEKWKELMKSSEKFLGSLPIVPLPGGWAIGINKLPEIWLTKRLDNITNTMDEKSREILQKRFPWAYWITDNSEGDKTAEEVNTIIQKIREGDVTEYKGLSEKEQTALETYYWWSDNAKAIVENITNNITQYNQNGVSTKIWEAYNAMTAEWHKNSDALHMTWADLDMAVQNDAKWKARAAGMIWWAVHTKDGVYMVDVVKGTEMWDNPLYRIVKREDYEKNHFEQAIPSVTAPEFNDWVEKQNLNDKYMKDYLDKLEAEYKDFKELSERKPKTSDENKMMGQFKELFTDDFKSILEKLAPDKFTKPQWQ